MIKKDELFVIECGKKRRAVNKKCKLCAKDFLCRKGKKSEFCSVNCVNTYRTDRVEVICSWCDKKFNKVRSTLKKSKSGLYFCSRECKDSAQKLGGIEQIMPPHYGTKPVHYRELFCDEEMKCNRCGYDEFIPSVQIHHIDHNKKNNNKSNLMPLCANCHQAFHFGLWK